MTPKRSAIPASLLLITLAGLVVAFLGTTLVPAPWLRFGLLLWLVALLPPYVLAYYRGLFGAAIGFLVGLTALGGAQLLALALGYAPPRWPLFTVVFVALVLVALATGAVTELLHRERERALELAMTDDLTALPNRRYGRAFLEHEFAAAIRGRPVVIVLFDLDHFKNFNDRFGHAAGDAALRAFGQGIADVTRRMNVSARWGGEEFLSILSGSTIPGALVFVERVRERTERLELAGGERITVSAGVAAYRPEMKTIEDLVAAADHALYQAKQRGRDCVAVDGPEPAGAVPAADPLSPELTGVASSADPHEVES